MLFNVYFLYRNHEPFGSLTKNCPKLDKNKSIVSRFSVFVVYKSAVNTIQKSTHEGSFNFRQWMLVFAHLFLDISIKSTKLHFHSWKKFPPTISLFFCKMTSEVLRNNCAKPRKDWKFPWYNLDISKLAGHSLPDVVFAYLHFNMPLTRLTGLAVEMYRMKRLLNFLETHTLLIQQKITEKIGLCTNNT